MCKKLDPRLRGDDDVGFSSKSAHAIPGTDRNYRAENAVNSQ
jgi:hypothetical protein